METQTATRLRTFVEAKASTHRHPERRQVLRQRLSTRTPSHRNLYRHQQVHLRCLFNSVKSTRLRTFVEAPTHRQPERRQRRQRRRLSTRTPSFHLSNMMDHFVKIFTKLKINVWTSNFAKVFNYVNEHHQSFRGALPQVLRPVALFNHMNDSLL